MSYVLSCAEFAPAVKVSSPESLRDNSVPLEEEETVEDSVDNQLAPLAPYFDDVFDGVAAKALAEDRLEAAMGGFDDIARLIDDPELSVRARFLAAYLAFRLGDNVRAAAELPQLATQLPLVADVAFESAAFAALKLKKYPEALEYASQIQISDVTKDMLVADIHRCNNSFSDAVEAYERIIENWPQSTRFFEAKAKRVECIAKSVSSDDPDENLIKDALSEIELLSAQAPSGQWTRFAERYEAELGQLIGDLPPRTHREKPATLKAFDKAQHYKQKMQHKKAETEFGKVIRLAKKNGTLKCRARYEQAVVVGRQRSHAKAANLFMEIADDCNEPSIKIRALYKGAKSCMAVDRYEDAIQLFNRIETSFPQHSFADDARLHTARSHLAMGNEDAFMELITSIPKAYPAGDMRAEALWEGAKHALSEGNYTMARQVLNQYYQVFPVEKDWYTAGRSGYWLGRTEELMGSIDEAIKRYEHVVATSPLSYYMVLSYTRLSRLNDENARNLIHRLAPPQDAPPLRFPVELLETSSQFATGVELVRLGLVSRGRRLLLKELRDPNTETDLHWATAALFRYVGQYTAAREISSEVSDGWSDRYPSGADLHRWQLAYPTAFQSEVEMASNESGIDKTLLWAIMREESGFNEKVESWANAIGLMQLIMPTARSMGRRIGITVNRKALTNPSVNVRLGAEYLSYLSEKFNGHPALIIAAYNAGEGAVGRWLRNKPDIPMDTFVEEIPFQQTRGYTKRVLSSLAVYQFLYNTPAEVLTPEFTLSR